MQEFIITTPEQLRTVISETVKDELNRHLQAQIPAEPIKHTDNDLITRKQAASVLGVSLPTLNEWSKSGIVTGYRISTRVRYKRSELEKSLAQMKTSKSKHVA
jgi:excisionase family DNA binding protein